MTATQTPQTTRLIASAVTADGFGDPELLIEHQEIEVDWDGHVDYIGGPIGDPVVREPIELDTEATGSPVEDIDVTLDRLGYRRLREWEPTDFGAVVVVEAWPTA